jgi:hypothetical protein
MSKLMTQSRQLIPAYGWTMEDSIAPDGSVARNILKNPLTRQQYILGQGGGAHGTHEASDVIQQTIDGVDTNELWAQFQASIELQNRQRQPLLDFITFTVTQPFEGVPAANSDARLERASERGLPRSYRAQGEFEWLGYDFAWRDMAFRYTWEFLVDATAAQVQSENNMALMADRNTIFAEIMWTLFNNVNRETSINERPYTVYTFYNGADGAVPPTYKTNEFDNTHNHYLVSGAAAISPGNAGTGVKGDLDDIIDHMAHHGYTRAEGADIVIMVNKQEGDLIRNWRSVANGGTSLYDFIPARNTPTFLLPINLRTPSGGTAELPAPTLRGMTVIGSYGEATIVEESYIPAGYVVGFATGGPDNTGNPIGFREHANPAMRGFRLVKGRSPDYPLQEAIYQRGFGTGIRRRGAGVVMQIKAAGVYEIPAEYATQP